MSNQNPHNVSYWELAKRFVEKEPKMVKEYADLAGINVDLFAHMTPRELCEQYRNQ
jgi:hypothetical protein